MTESAARKQAKRESAFYRSLVAFVLVNAFLIALNLLTSPSHLWFIYPLLGWGIGIASQAFSTFGSRGDSWIDQRTQELMGAEASEDRLREMLYETLDERAVPAGPPQDTTRLQRRIEHLEAIVTSRDWDEIRTDAAPAAEPLAAPPLLDGAPDLSPQEQVRQMARRVR